MSQLVSSDKRKEKALAAWGSPDSIGGLKVAFAKMLSDGGLFPWADAGLPKATLALSSQLQAMVMTGMMPINALPQVRLCGMCAVHQVPCPQPALCMLSGHDTGNVVPGHEPHACQLRLCCERCECSVSFA
jgi:hypothetical protein